MKIRKCFMVLMGGLFFAITGYSQTQTVPWATARLMEPELLAAILNDSTTAQPLIINMGPVNSIKGSIKIGPAKEKENLDELKKLLLNQDRKKTVVIYCGCCPFKDCLNIRPAFSLLKQMNFENGKLLDLPHNLKVDWINHDYPMSN